MNKDYLRSFVALVLIGMPTCLYIVRKDAEITARYNFTPEIDYKVMEVVRQDTKQHLPEAEKKMDIIEETEVVEVKEDSRKAIAKAFLDGYGSPVTDTDYIVDVSDKYGVDYKKVIAIAGCETSFWKNLNYSWNAWGYGVWSGKQHGDWDWSTYEIGLDSFTRELGASKYNSMSIIEMSNAGYNPSQHWKNTCGQFYNELVQLEK